MPGAPYWRCDVLSGSTVTFDVDVPNIFPPECVGPFLYSWRRVRVGVTTEMSTASGFTTTPQNNDDYYCIVTGTTCTCLTSNPASSKYVRTVLYTVTGTTLKLTGPVGEVCSGTTLTYICYQTGYTNPYYQFKVDGSDVGTSGTTNSWSTNNLSASASGTLHSITCDVSEGSGGVLNLKTSNTLNIYVYSNYTPHITINYDPNNPPPWCVGEYLNFSMVISHLCGSIYLFTWWIKPFVTGVWVEISGAAHSPSYSSSSLEDGDEIKLVVTNIPTIPTCCSTTGVTESNVITMDITAITEPIVSIVSNVTCIPTALPQTISFTGNTTNGGTSPSYYWYSIPATSVYTGSRWWSVTLTSAIMAGYNYFSAICNMTPDKPCNTLPYGTDTKTLNYCNFYEGQSYGGGIVYYISSNYIYICASNDWYQTTWNCWQAPIVTGLLIGSGWQNTSNIYDWCVNNSSLLGAGWYCWGCSVSGYTDWFLPSRNELAEMWVNRNYGLNLTFNWYWSSSSETNVTAIRLQIQDVFFLSYENYNRNSSVVFRGNRRESIQNYWYIGKNMGDYSNPIIVFYVGQDWVLMACAEEQLIPWGCWNYTVGGTVRDIYYGLNNTNWICSLGCSTGGAAKYCQDLWYYGYHDWFLPSTYELEIMVSQRGGLLYMINGHSYWSSTEYDKLESECILYNTNVGQVAWINHRYKNSQDWDTYCKPIRRQARIF